MKNRAILITGGTTGIGLATAKLLGAEGTKMLVVKGFCVFGSVRKQAEADRLQRDFGNGFVPLLMDITDADAVHQAAQKVGSLFGDKFPTFDMRNDNVIRRELIPL